jgi:hypothetical protein
MRTKALYLAASLLLVFASAGASRSTSNSQKIQVIAREQANGEWQIFLFGVPDCPSAKNLQVSWPPRPHPAPRG